MDGPRNLDKIVDILACPVCKRTQWRVLRDDEMLCSSCGTTYPVQEGIPVLLKDRADAEIAHLAKINEDDMKNFRGEAAYTKDGHDRHLMAGIGAKPGDLVLDLGCGHGHVSKWVAESASATVVSYDILFPALRLVQNPFVICGSADNITFRDNVFDIVIFTDVLEHIPPSMVERVVSEIYRVLKPGGVLYLDYPGSKLPYYTGYPVLNMFIALARLFGSRREYHTLDREPEAHVNLSFPRAINSVFARRGFSGKARPKITKFFSIPARYRKFAAVLNIFPLNYFFAQQMIGRYVKPGPAAARRT